MSTVLDNSAVKLDQPHQDIHAQLGSAGYASYILTDRFIKQNPDSARKFVEGTARAIERMRASSRSRYWDLSSIRGSSWRNSA